MPVDITRAPVCSYLYVVVDGVPSETREARSAGAPRGLGLGRGAVWADFFQKSA